jgi:hypothetical protein
MRTQLGALVALLLTLSGTVPAAREAVRAPSGSNVTSIGDVYADPGTSGAFGIDCASEDAIASAQVEFTYDSTIGLDVTGASITNRTSGFSTSFSQDNSDPSAVEVTILLFNVGALTISPGSGPILSVQYTVAPDGSGDSPLDLTNVLRSDPVGTPLNSSWQDGAFHINPLPPTNTPTATPTDTPTATPASTPAHTPTPAFRDRLRFPLVVAGPRIGSGASRPAAVQPVPHLPVLLRTKSN